MRWCFVVLNSKRASQDTRVRSTAISVTLNELGRGEAYHGPPTNLHFKCQLNSSTYDRMTTLKNLLRFATLPYNPYSKSKYIVKCGTSLSYSQRCMQPCRQCWWHTVSIHLINNKKPTTWWGRQNAAPLKLGQKPLDAAFSAVFVFRTSINADQK